MKSKAQIQAEQEQRAFVRKLIAAEILAKRGEGPLALRPPVRPVFAGALEGALRPRP